MKQRPFRFGVVSEGAPSREEWIAKVRKVEELGYSTFFMPDHFVNEFLPMVALMSAADATSTLRVGSFVFDNDFRHPALLAKEAAVLDLLSGGRLELGIGAGWHRPEYDQVGLPFDPAGVRINRLEEALQIIKAFFTEESVTFSLRSGPGTKSGLDPPGRRRTVRHVGVEPPGIRREGYSKSQASSRRTHPSMAAGEHRGRAAIAESVPVHWQCGRDYGAGPDVARAIQHIVFCGV